MAPLLEDPRIRQTWNHISHNAETATESAATGIWTFTHRYVNPCFSTVASTFGQCTGSCFPDREDRARRLRERGRTRGRAEFSFDFYDDWDDDDEVGGSSGLLGWGNDELDRLLAGSGTHGDEQPTGRKRRMSYGTKGGRRRKKTIDGLPDPTIIPSTNSIGFLQRLPWKFGGTLRYKPSAADLQEHPGLHRAELGDEREALIDEGERSDNGDGSEFNPGHRRKRSSTIESGNTTDSFRSRGDLFPSDGEDDAVPLGDEFAMVLERRMTGLSVADDRSSGRTGDKGKKRAGSRAMSRTASGTTLLSDHSRPSLAVTRESSSTKLHPSERSGVAMSETPSIVELQEEEERLRREEEAELERKRHAAGNLAVQRGLTSEEALTSEMKQESPAFTDNSISPPFIKDTYPEDVEASTNESTPVRVIPGVTECDFIPARLPNFGP